MHITGKSEVMLLKMALKKESVTLTVGRKMTFTDLLRLLRPALNVEKRKVIKFTPKMIIFFLVLCLAESSINCIQDKDRDLRKRIWGSEVSFL